MPDRFVSPAPLPSDYQRELMVIAMEECAEVAQRISKAIRFGLDEVQLGQGLTNLDRVAEEFGDLNGALALLLKTVQPGAAARFKSVAEQASNAKREKIARFMQAEAPPLVSLDPAYIQKMTGEGGA